MKPELFLRWYDGDSEKVMEFIKTHDLEGQVDYIDVDEDELASTSLIHLTGKDDVPCLLHESKAIFGYKKIIDWISDQLLGRGDAVIT